MKTDARSYKVNRRVILVLDQEPAPDNPRISPSERWLAEDVTTGKRCTGDKITWPSARQFAADFAFVINREEMKLKKAPRAKGVEI